MSIIGIKRNTLMFTNLQSAIYILLYFFSSPKNSWGGHSQTTLLHTKKIQWTTRGYTTIIIHGDIFKRKIQNDFPSIFILELTLSTKKNLELTLNSNIMIWIWHHLEIFSFNTGFSSSETIIILIQQIITIFQKHIRNRRNSRISPIIIFMGIKSNLPYIMSEVFTTFVLHIPHPLPDFGKIHWPLYDIQVVRGKLLGHWFQKQIRQVIPIFHNGIHNTLQDICQTNLHKKKKKRS